MSKNLFSLPRILAVFMMTFGFVSFGNAQALSAETTSNSSIFNSALAVDFSLFEVNFGTAQPVYAPNDVHELLFDSGSVFNVDGPPPISFLQDASLGLDTFGFGCQVSAGNLIADDFELETSATISTIDFFTYQTGEFDVSINGVYLQIYDGEPGAGGNVIWGDMSTNVFASVEHTGGYRQIESTPGDTSRIIQRVTADMQDLFLEPGTYWLEVTFDGSGVSGPWAPPITITGQSVTGNAIQFTPANGYLPLLDTGTGTQQGLPFQIYGEAGELENCEGTPDAGSISGITSICPGIGFTLKAEGSTSGFDGLVRQWQSSPAGQNDWTDVEGANTANYNVAGGISQDMDYRFVVSCTHSGESDTTDVHTVTVNSPNECYCTPSISSVEPITRVVVADIDNSSDANSTLPYEDFTHIEGHVAPAEAYEIALEGNTSGPYTNYFTVFVDWNQNGIFNDPGEVYEIGFIENSTGTDGQQALGVIEVPDDAVTGTTRMRVIKNYNSSPLDPCGSYSFGQIEDYTFVIGEIDDCEGTPDAGSIEGPDSVCANTGFTLHSVDATSGAAGLVREWQSSPAGQDDWSVIEGATTGTLNVSGGINVPMDYRFVLTCSASGESDITAVHSVGLNPGTECYCTPEPMFVEAISRVAISDIDNSSDPNSDIPYEDFTDIQGHMAPGGTYSGEFEGNTSGTYTNYFTVFIDWNQNGSFSDPGEMYEIGFISNSTGTDGQMAVGDVVVPTDAMVGSTRMRVIKNYNDSPTDPCGNYTFGQVEDYTILVAPMEDCEGTPDGGTVTVSPEQGNPGTSYLVKAAGYGFGNGITYQWQSNTDEAGWVNEGDESSTYSHYSATAPSVVGVTVDWRLLVTCANSGETGESSSATFVTQDPGCGFETPSNGFENGFGFMDVYERANDFIIPLGTRFIVDQVKVNMFLLDGPESMDAAQISFYKDTGNGPGEFEGGEIFIEPTSVEYVGSNFGLDVFTLTFDIDPVTLDGSEDSETIYWMGILLYTFGGDNSYWEVNTITNTPNGFYSNVDGEWTPITDPGDGVMEIGGECETLSLTPELEIFDFAYYPNPVKDVLNITSKTGVQSVTAYNMAGQRVLDVNKVKAANGQVDVSALSQGVYIFRTVLENGQVETFKIVKK